MSQTEAVVLKADRREQIGTRSARRERESGRVPAIIYGHKQEPVAVSLDYHDLTLELQHHHKLLTIALDGSESQYLVKEVQFNHLGDKVLHVDLTRVDLDERVAVSVEIELKGTPKGATDGGVLDHMMAAIELECLVTNIPESVRVLVNDLGVGEILTAGQVELPQGTKLLTDPDTPVAACRTIAEQPEIEEVEGEEAAEPERIARERAEEESEDA